MTTETQIYWPAVYAQINRIIQNYYPGPTNSGLRQRLRKQCKSAAEMGCIPRPGYGTLFLSGTPDQRTQNMHRDLLDLWEAHGLIHNGER